MALKYAKRTEEREGSLAWGSYLAESAQIKDYLREELAHYGVEPVSLEELRSKLNQQLKGQNLTDLVRQMREESEH